MRTTHTHVITGLICFLLALAGVAQAQSLGGDTPTTDTPVIQTTPPDSVTPPDTPGDDATVPPESTTPPDEGTPPVDETDEPDDEYDEPDENDDTVGKAKVTTPRFTG